MARISDLPDHILLGIVHDVASEATKSSLQNLCLVSRKIGHIAQLVLYRAPSLEPTVIDNGNSAIFQFARTLVRRPDLNTLVHELDISVYDQNSNQIEKGSDEEEASEGHETDDSSPSKEWNWEEPLESFIQALKEQPLTVVTDSWVRLLRRGSPLAVCGFILARTTSLRHLQIREFGSFWGSETRHLSSRDLFGISDIFFPFEHIPAVQGLRSLTTHGLIPSGLISLPELQQVRFALENRGWWLPTEVRLPHWRSETITHMIIDVDIEILEGRISYIDENDSVYEQKENNRTHQYLKDLLFRIKQLEYLEIRLSRSENPSTSAYDSFYGCPPSFARLMRLLRSETLRHLIIETSNINPLEFFENFASQLHPMTTLRRLPKLRRIAAPQEAFLYRGDHKKSSLSVTLPSVLLATIETLEIIDSTIAYNALANHLARHRIICPHLQEVVLWCDRQDSTLALDAREDVQTEHDAWQRLRDTGVEVVEHDSIGEYEKGWRKSVNAIH